MAGTIPLSMTQQFDVYGKPLAGGQLFIIQAGTVSTPQDAFQDTGLAVKMPYPMTLDAAGRIPQFFLDNSVNSTVKIRLQDKSGVVQLAADSVLIIGPAGGGGGGSTVDPTQLIQMGNMIWRYGVGVLAGYVRLNGNTVGSAVSGATERANSDCQALFQYLWGVDTTLVVTGGRGVTPAADWAANKQIAIPDWRGFLPGALDDMGAAAAGRLGAPWFTGATTLGATGGVQNMALVVGNIPPHTHGVAGTTQDDAPDHTHPFAAVIATPGTPGIGTGGVALPANQIGSNTGGASARHRHNFLATTDTGAGAVGTGFGLIQPTKLATFYLKL